jgi:prepilin-type N-terminal cleavage/methylation domain-containing protein
VNQGTETRGRKTECRDVLNSEPKTSPAGFTLVELIVVMVLITMMTAFAIPKIRSSLFTDQLRATARKFIGLVAETGQEARSKRTEVKLRFDREQHLFTTAPAAGIAEDDTIKRYPTVRVSESVQVVDITSVHSGKKTLGELVILFSPRGYVDKTVVHLRDDGGDELSVILSPFLGVTRVLEGYVSLDDDRFTSAGN